MQNANELISLDGFPRVARGKGKKRFPLVLLLLVSWGCAQTTLIKPEMQPMLTSEIDPKYECIPIQSQSLSGEIATPPPGDEVDSGQRLCPEGYVPRLKRKSYLLEGKEIITPEAKPERNPSTPVGEEDD